MYVIIDWHILKDGNPNTHIAEAKQFFADMSRKYANYDNVLYEICNEPNGSTTWSDVKKYADTIIPIIRENDPDAIILVGTPTWSQDVDQVASNPVKQKKNVMYVMHFYAATHKEWLRDKLKSARAAGTPVFITECSSCSADGNGSIEYSSANEWKKLINDNMISFVGWSLSNKNETSAIIRSSCSKHSGWSDSELTDSGRYLKQWIQGK
jgi:endoglucanase